MLSVDAVGCGPSTLLPDCLAMNATVRTSAARRHGGHAASPERPTPRPLGELAAVAGSMLLGACGEALPPGACDELGPIWTTYDLGLTTTGFLAFEPHDLFCRIDPVPTESTVTQRWECVTPGGPTEILIEAGEIRRVALPTARDPRAESGRTYSGECAMTYRLADGYLEHVACYLRPDDDSEHAVRLIISSVWAPTCTIPR